jgi:hypothetical protein
MSVQAKVTVGRSGEVRAAFSSGRNERVGWVQRSGPSTWSAIRDGGRVVTDKAKRRSAAVAELLEYAGIEAA